MSDQQTSTLDKLLQRPRLTISSTVNTTAVPSFSTYIFYPKTGPITADKNQPVLFGTLTKVRLCTTEAINSFNQHGQLITDISNTNITKINMGVSFLEFFLNIFNIYDK